jgi:hypothetical protein
VKYHLIIDEALKAEMSAGQAAWKADPRSAAGHQFNAAMKALKALQEGREGEYEGKRLGYGPRSYDLRDTAQIKVPVFEEYKDNGWPMGPSHRMTYREFDPLPKVEGGKVVPDTEARPFRHVVAFAHRSEDPAAITGERLGREQGRPDRALYGLTGGGRPSVGPRRDAGQTTPHRTQVPPDLLHAARLLSGSPPAGTAPRPEPAPRANVNRARGPGTGRSEER